MRLCDRCLAEDATRRKVTPVRPGDGLEFYLDLCAACETTLRNGAPVTVAPAVDQLARLAAFAQDPRFGVALVRAPSGDWSAALEWGREAPDSPMVGAAAYGLGDTVEDALRAALDEAGA